MNKGEPRVSIIVATFNAAALLQECVDSIAGQTFAEWELLVADGGSWDATVDIIRGNGDHIAWWTSQADGGIYDAWNHAIGHARGEYVLFLGADDRLHSPRTLFEVFEAIGTREYDIVSGRGELVDSAGVGYHQFGNPWNHRRIRRRMTICHPGALHRRELFNKFGLFDTSYRICADYDFILRLPEETRALFIDAPLASIRDAGISRMRRSQALFESYLAQSRCPRVGPVFAAFNYLDKIWRIPVARLLGIPN